MGFLDVWTIVTGAASIISLLIAMSDKLPEWRKYIVPTGFILAGFSVGRISIGALPGAKESLQDPRLIGFLMLLMVVFVMLYMFLREMVKRNQDFYAYFVVFMVLIIVVPQLMDKYFVAFPSIPAEDYLQLASQKEKTNDITGAIRYLEKYILSVQDEGVKKQIQAKIGQLHHIQLGIPASK
jgi:hypothetical protein